jgi:hypothetical protein
LLNVSIKSANLPEMGGYRYVLLAGFLRQVELLIGGVGRKLQHPQGPSPHLAIATYKLRVMSFFNPWIPNLVCGLGF